MAAAMDVLERVEVAVAARRLPEALALCLAEWRRTRSPLIAQVIDGFSGELAPQAALKARPAAQFQKDWLAAAVQPDEVLLGWLAQSLTQRLPLVTSYDAYLDPRYLERKYTALLARVEALSKLPDDPRVARALTELVREAPVAVTHAAGARLIYGKFLALVGKIRDVRSAKVFEGLLRAPRARQEGLRSYLSRALPETIAGLQRTRPEVLGAAVKERWARLDRSASATPADDARYLEAIHAAPGDDSVRLVYADWLLERGDPRGEFISLQIQQARGEGGAVAERRARALVRAHQAQWLGDELSAVLMRVEFERGFLVEAALAQNVAAVPEVWARAPSDARLETLQRLEKGRGSIEHYEAFALSPRLRKLEEVEVLRAAFLDTLLARRSPVRGLKLAKVPKGRRAQTLAEVLGTCSVRQLTVAVSDSEVRGLATILAQRPIDTLVLSALDAPRTSWRGLFATLWPWVGAELRLCDWRGPVLSMRREGAEVRVEPLTRFTFDFRALREELVRADRARV